MEKEKIIEICNEIFNLFDPPSSARGSMDEELVLSNFLTWLTQEEYNFVVDTLDKSDLKLEGQHVEDVFTFGIWIPLAHTAFSLGFTLGSLIEVSDPSIQEKIETLRGVIKEAALVPFVPRAKGK